MASRRKTFPTKSTSKTLEQMHAEFIAEVLKGNVKATRLIVVKNGREHLDYDDPNG